MSDTPETDKEADSIVISSKGCCDIYAVKKNVTIGKNLVDADFARRLERERNALKKQLSEIEKYGVEEINTAVELRSRLAATLVERDEYKRRWQDWERWAKQVMMQYFRRVPLDATTVGMRNNLTRWMQEMKDQK